MVMKKNRTTAECLTVLEFALRVTEVVDVKDNIKDEFKILANKLIKRLRKYGDGVVWDELPLSKDEERRYDELSFLIVGAGFSRYDDLVKRKQNGEV